MRRKITCSFFIMLIITFSTYIVAKAAIKDDAIDARQKAIDISCDAEGFWSIQIEVPEKSSDINLELTLDTPITWCDVYKIEELSMSVAMVKKHAGLIKYTNGSIINNIHENDDINIKYDFSNLDKGLYEIKIIDIYNIVSCDDIKINIDGYDLYCDARQTEEHNI